MPDIDSLSIQITSDASQAERAIDSLVLKLGSLKTGLSNLGKIRFGNTFSTAATGISRIADAANKIGADALNRISDSLVRLSGIDLSGIGGADQFKALSSGLAQLGKVKIGTAAKQLPTVVTALRDLSGIQVPATDIAELGKSLGKLGSSNAQKAITNMPQLANAFKQLVSDLNNLPTINSNVVQLAQAFASLAQNGNQAGNILRNTSTSFSLLGSGALKANSSVNILKKSMDAMHNSINGILGKITRLTAGFLSFRAVFNVLKDSVEVASAITEVQNVVDKTFGETRTKLEDFAKTAVSSYGMSELTAKKIASQFQAMGATVGLTTQQIGDAHEFLSDRIHEAYQVENAEMADMSVNLTKLTSDMASFYDVSQEDVATKLQAIFTGASRPLRQFGIDLTQATLQEWALKHGIDAEVKSMTQAEKVMLRYMYVMDRTAVAQGDFADTINSWHNQVTLLTEGFKQLKAIVGQGLINMFRPFLMSLNSAMNTAIDLVQKAFNAMGKLLGWQIEIEDVQGSLGFMGSDFDSEDEDLGEADVSEADKAADDIADTTEELADAADSAEDVGGGMNDAAEGAKELKRQIMSFDELHTLADNSEDVAKALKDAQNSVPKVKDPKDSAKKKDKDKNSKDDASEAYADGLEEGTITGGNVTFKPYESNIESWFGFGRAISDTLAQAMEDIDWNKIYEKARNFGKGLAEFLNGLITPRTFGDLGRTIAGALNTALNFLNSFGHNFNWKNLGDSIATEVNEFFRTFDFGLLADTMNTWANGLLDALIAWLEKTDWDLIGEKIGEFLEALDFVEIGKKVGKAIWLAINAGFKVFKNMFEAAPLETALLTLVTVAGALKTKPVADFALALSNAVKKVNIFFTALGNGSGVVGALVAAFPGLTGVLNAFSTAVATFKLSLSNSKNVVKAFYEGVESLGTFMTPVTKAVLGIAGAAADLIITKDATADIAHNLFEGNTSLSNLLLNAGKIGGAFAAASIAFTPVFGFPGGIIAAGLTSAIGAVIGLREEVEKEVDYTVWEGIMTVLSQPGGTPIEDLTQHYTNTFAAISSGFTTIASQSADVDTLKQSVADTNDQIDLIAFGIENGTTVTDEKVDELIGLYNDLYAQTKQIMDDQYNVIMRGLSGAMSDSLQQVGLSSADVVAAMDTVKNQYETEMDEIIGKMNELQTAYHDGKITQEEYTTSYQPLLDRYNEVTGKTSEFDTAVNDLSSTVNGVSFQSIITEVDGVNQIDMSALRDQITQVGTAYTNAETDVDNALEGMQSAMRDYVEMAQQQGNTDALDVFAKTIESNAASAKQAKDDLTDHFNAYADTIQTAVLQDLPDVIDQASKDYDNLNPFVKLLTPGGKEEFIAKSVASYKSEVIDPLEGELQAAYSQFGVDGTTWVNDAYTEITNAMYDENVIRNALGDPQRVEYVISETASDNVRKALEKVDYKSHWKKAGEQSASGYEGGLNNGQKDVETAASDLMKVGIDSAKTELDSHSPSKVYWDIGKDTIDGYNSGIDDNKDTTTTSVTSWMNEASDIIKGKWEEFTSWWKNTGFKNWWDNDVAANFTRDKWENLGENMKSGLTGKWNEITSWWDTNVVSVFRNSISEIQNLFSGISFNMPQIVLPHIVFDGWEDFGVFTFPAYHIDWYEKGGFIEDGLFTMNQGEMAGKFSNGTSVVANNQMITDSISSAVERAIVQQLPGIIESAVSRADTGGDVYIGDEQIYMASKRGEARANKRYSPSIAY